MIPAPAHIPEPEKRKPLTKWEFATLFLEQQGKCAVCGARLERGKTRDEHVVALESLGSNDLENRQLWCLPCTKPKDVADAKARAKQKRLRGETKVGPKQSIPKPANPWPPKGSRKLPSRRMSR
ncbi:MAG: HNH endonuclease signature motif containing protein [Pseudomonadota bacterium]